MNKRKEICNYLTENCGDKSKRFVYLSSQDHHSLLRIQPWKEEHVYIEMDDKFDKIIIGIHGVPFDFNTFSWYYRNEERNVLRNIYQNRVLNSIAKRLGFRDTSYSSMISGRIPFVGLDIKAKGEFTEKEKNLVDKVAKAAKDYHTIINNKNYKKEAWGFVTKTSNFISDGLDTLVSHG